MSRNEQIKKQKIVLYQLAMDTPLNKVFKLVIRVSKATHDIKGISCQGNLIVASLGRICGKQLVDLRVVAEINSHEVSKFRLS